MEPFRPPYSSGGWLDPNGGLSEKARASILKSFPKISVDKIARETGFYLIERDAFRKFPSPEDARNHLDRLKSEGLKFALLLDDLIKSPVKEYIEQASYLIGENGDIRALERSLSSLLISIAKARTMVPIGRRMQHPRQRLILSLASLLKEAGMPVSAAGGQPLCILTAIVTEGLGESHSDVRALVRGALGKRRTANASSHKQKGGS